MLIVEGNKYRGYFIGEMYQYEVEGSPAVKGYDAFDYRGTGAVEIRNTDGRFLFHFRTPTFLRYRTKGEHLELEAAVINWGQELIDINPRKYIIVAYSEIVDLALESLLRRVRMDNLPIPDVETDILAGYDLLNRGFLALAEDQMAL